MHPITDIPPVSRVLDASSTLFDIPADALVGRSRRSALVRARQIAWYVAHEFLGYSYPVIGEEWNRDHTTVLYGVRRIAELLEAGEPGVELRVERLRGAVS